MRVLFIIVVDVKSTQRFEARSPSNGNSTNPEHRQTRLAADKPREEYRFLSVRIERIDPGNFARLGAHCGGKTLARQLFESLFCFGQRRCIVSVEVVAGITVVVHHDLRGHWQYSSHRLEKALSIVRFHDRCYLAIRAKTQRATSQL